LLRLALHPTKHTFEVFAHGTSNPWGLDYNEHGEFFIEACVIPHCFHIIQGARYMRQAGSHFNPYTYADIGTIADHLHYVGATPHGGNTRSDAAGGGHAHCGLMCYLGGAWPKKYHGQLFMGNIHGRRINMDILKPKGSGYVASHGPDFLLANDEWARFINLKYGPDGNVYLIDWYDKQAPLEPTGNLGLHQRPHLKISYRGTKPVKDRS
jgi:putative membrane-bound dehydrogenase-like protein